MPDVRHLVLAAVCVAADPAGAAGDAQRGQQAYETRCGGCHSVDADRVGPRHAGVLGRRAGSVPGFAYSDALRKSSLTWDATLLERWLADPEALVPGQRMGYRLARRAGARRHRGLPVHPGRGASICAAW